MTLDPNFFWGGAISANQVEGNFDKGGRGLTNFDMLPMNNERLKDVYIDQENFLGKKYNYYPGRKGINFYNFYKEDIALLSQMGINSFRFSIAWSRIFPTGEESVPNEEGLQFYEKILQELKKVNIEPIVTISHFDIPMHLVEKYCGWYSREVVDLYTKFAATVMNRFKSLVKYWIPFNEMNMTMHIPFIGAGLTFTSEENKLSKKYQAAHHQLLANAKTIKIGKEINPNFQFGCMMAAAKTYPYTCRPEDVFAAFEHEKHNFFFSDVQIKGKYPKYISTYFRNNNIDVVIDQEDHKIFRENTVDFLSFSYYASACSAAADQNIEKEKTNGPDTIKNPYLSESMGVWQMDPVGLRSTLNQLYDRYEIPLFIVENGLGTYEDTIENGKINDSYRINYLREHIKNMILAVEEDGVELIGYLMWGIIDLVSVSEGKMSKRYGVIYVDADDQGNGSYSRIKKESYYWYSKVVKSNGSIIRQNSEE